MSCKCNVGLGNTGIPGCVPIQSVTSSLIMVQLKANDGSENRIDLSSLPTWSDLINEVDASKRWFPLPSFENVEQPKADSQFEEAASGKMAFLRQGKRSFTGELWEGDSSPQFLGKLEEARCVKFGVYVVDVEGNLIGSNKGDGYLYPIPVDNASWDPKWSPATDSTVQKIMLSFDWDRLFDESTLEQITASEAGQNFTELEGLLDVLFTNIVPGTTSTTFTAKFCYGTAITKLAYGGATAVADWSIYNDTTSSSVTVDAVTETPANSGNYQLDHAAGIASTNAYTVSTSKDGFIGEFATTAP